LTTFANYQQRFLKIPFVTRMQLSKTSKIKSVETEIRSERSIRENHFASSSRTVELIGIEPTTSALQGRRSPN
jgi:hypothetical protein